MSKVTIREAAKMLGTTEQYLRVSLQRGLFPFGNAVKLSSSRWTYYVNEQRLLEYLGGNVHAVGDDKRSTV
jgi:hypothetical protein